MGGANTAMTRKSTLSPRKRPRQERSRRTVEAILDAAARVFETVGPNAATTNAIAERAGVSVGSLYQYFPNKLAKRIVARYLAGLAAMG